MKIKAYLAAPFFTEKENKIYKQVIDLLKKYYSNLELYVPKEHEIENGYSLPNALWGQKVFIEDCKAIDNSDVVFVVNYGMYSDSGTAWECGYAYAKGKKVVQFLVNDTKEFSLMMINGSSFYNYLSDEISLDNVVKEIEQK